MKKVVLTLTLIGLFSFNSYSQDEANKAIDLYNQIVEDAKSENYASAIAKANEAYTIAKTVSEGTEEVKANLEKIIPQLYLGKAKKSLTDSKFEEALTEFNEAAAEAKKFNNAEIVQDAVESIPKVYLAQGDDLFKANDFEGAVAAFDKALAIDTANAQAYFIKGASLLKLGKSEEAVAVLEKTVEIANATDKTSVANSATTQIVNIYTRAAAEAQKAKKWADVVTNAEKALSYNPEKTTQLLQLVDLGNLQQGAALANSNKTKACQFLKKVKNDAKLKENATQYLKTLGCN
ncbi:MAG: tetratricopeptide repeat protein [Prevotellaceae bacterium]|jgi:tetratricopeptide (TPR) repeat protein|nr:tetratricopeptide repeat protein [Prevotellaceae bacterium]